LYQFSVEDDDLNCCKNIYVFSLELTGNPNQNNHTTKETS
jgi:hypothetical protein